MSRNLIKISDLTPKDVDQIIEKAFHFKNGLDEKPLDGKTVALLFFENSTRTRYSFELAAKKLGAHVLVFNPTESSLSKGESLEDTFSYFESLGIDICVVRHKDEQFIEDLKSKSTFKIINAGAGKNEHPTQALLDFMTLKENFGDKLSQVKLSISGDIRNSRVAKSNIELLRGRVQHIFLTGPSDFLPDKKNLYPNVSTQDIDEIIRELDALMYLRVQHERHKDLVFNTENFLRDFGLNQKRLPLLKKETIIMHPGPVNWGVELDISVRDLTKTKISQQITNGLFSRMAILEWIQNDKL